jgi:hypothetical protein
MSERFKRIVAFIAAQKKRIAVIGLGYTFGNIFDYVFNYGIYIPVVAMLGPIKGGVVMAIISASTCFLFIKFYDWLKQDWLGIEVAKEATEYGPTRIRNFNVTSRIGKFLWWPFSRIVLLILWAIKRGGIVAFFALSMYTDPFVATVYFRKESFSGLKKRDWMIFFASLLVGDLYWTLRTVLIIFLAKEGMKIF